MTYYQERGTIPAKHFTVLPKPNGGRYYEELHNSLGFNGPLSLLYRINQPSRVLRVEPLTTLPLEPWNEGVVRNHIIDPALLKASGDILDSRVPVAFNADLSYSVASPDRSSDRFYRNAERDELLFIVQGTGTFESTFGVLHYGPMDFICVPRGATWRILPNAEPQRMILLETRGQIQPPARYRNNVGQFMSRATYSERDIRVPELGDPTDEKGEFEIAVKVNEIVTTYVLDSHPLDVVGWAGALYPYALNMRDVEPFSGRVSLDPDMDAVFECEGALVSAITPARFPDHPDAIPNIPDHNTDCDEILYRVASEGAQVHGLEKLTVHTRAAGHGAKPGHDRAEPGLMNELWAVLIDIINPLQLTTNAIPADDPAYPSAWL